MCFYVERDNTCNQVIMFENEIGFGFIASFIIKLALFDQHSPINYQVNIPSFSSKAALITSTL